MPPLPRREHPSSLHGSLDSFPLADVLTLLAATGNTGALEVTGDGTAGRLYVDDGAVVAAAIGDKDTAVDVVVEMLRLEDGSFVFAPDETTDRPGPPVAVPGLLAEARTLLDEWYEIEAVLPSADHVVTLAAAAPRNEIVLSGSEWRALAAIGGGGPVGLVLDLVADDELEARRLLRRLVDSGLVEVSDPIDQRVRGGQATAADPPPGGLEPVLLLRPAPKPRRPVDPALEARLESLAKQLDVLYEAAEADAAEGDGAGPPPPRAGLFGRRRHRPER